MKKAYISNQFGFSETGRYLLDNLFYPKFTEFGIEILDPFVECSKLLDKEFLLKISNKSYAEVYNFWMTFNKQVMTINNELMAHSECMIAILDGGHTVDDGVASEIGFYYAQTEYFGDRPIFALRTDLRLCDNLVANVNAQVLGYIKYSNGGNLFDNTKEFFDVIKNWSNI